MNKYRDALYRLDDGEHTIEDFELLQRLAKEKDEQESRKDKLIVGSEWECVVKCHGVYADFSIGEIVTILSISEGGYINFSNDAMIIPQFLLCFKPR
jgi:hypothetical protein